MKRTAFSWALPFEALAAPALILCACVLSDAPAARALEMPRTDVGRYAAAYFHAFNSGDPDTMLAFSENAYSFAYLETTPPERRASNYQKLLDTFGALEPLRVARSLDRQLTLVVHPEKGDRALVMRFQLELEPPHRLAYVSIGGIDRADAPEERVEHVASRSAPVDLLLRNSTVQAVAEALRREYASPELGARMADTLMHNLAVGRYDVAIKAGKLADLLTEDAQAVSKDRRVRIEARNPMAPAPAAPDPAPPAKEVVASEYFRVSVPCPRDGIAAQVRAAETAFAKTMADRDLDAFKTYVAEEALFFGSKRVLRGRDAVAAGWSAYFEGKDAPFSWAPETVEALDSGTLALSSGPVLDPSGKRIGTFNSIWRLDADGRWRVVFDKGCPPCECPPPEKDRGGE